MLNTFMLVNSMKKSLDGGLYRLLERREVVIVTARMVDFGKQNGKFLKYVSERVGWKHLKLNQ